MASIFTEDNLEFDAFREPVRSVLVELVGVKVTTGAGSLAVGHLLLALQRRQNRQVQQLLKEAMRPKQSVEELADALLDYYSEEDAVGGPASITRSSLTTEAVDLLAQLAERFPAGQPPATEEVDARLLLQLVCKHLPHKEKQLLSHFFDVEAAAAGQLGTSKDAAALTLQIFAEDGSLNQDGFTSSGIKLLESALRFAARTGHLHCQVTHLLAACFDSRNDQVQQILRVFGQRARLKDARDTLLELLARSMASSPLPAARDSFSTACQIVLDRMAKQPAGPLAILLALLKNSDIDAYARDALVGPPLSLDLDAAIAHLDRLLDEIDEAKALPAETQLPSVLTDLENLTLYFGDASSVSFIERPERENLERALFSPEVRCVVVYGEPGSGRTALVESVARRAARGEIPFLTESVFLRIDAGMLEENARAGTLQRILRGAGDDSRIVLVVENFHCLAESVATPLRKHIEHSEGLRLIGVTTTADYGRAITPNRDLHSAIWRVETAPTDHETTVKILQAVAPRLEKEYGVSIRRGDLPRIAQLADTYLSSVQRPKRAVRLLRWGCDEAGFAASTPGDQPAEADFVRAGKALAARTGIDEEQVLGLRGAQYYRGELQKAVVGQSEAVEMVSQHIIMARRGARGGERPAGVLLFAGQTGTGKTLLAKEMAKVYSPKGVLHTFAMGDFKDRHDVKRLIGAPPSYVGYDEGGQLVTKLLQAPNSVVLFDEAEKAHPEVWDACLQLFAEGWIEDSRRQVAHAGKALFVLTTNLCQEEIAECFRHDLHYEQIEDVVSKEISSARRPDRATPYFRTELLGRIDRVVVFRPLDVQALEQIALIEILHEVQAHLQQRSIVLTPEGADWSPLARLLSESCRNDPKHGRAVIQQFRRHVTFPLANSVMPSDDTLAITVRVEGEEHDQTVGLYTPDGTSLTPGRK